MSKYNNFVFVSLQYINYIHFLYPKKLFLWTVQGVTKETLGNSIPFFIHTNPISALDPNAINVRVTA